MTFQNPRQPDHPVSRQFVDRWSPRAYTGADIPDADLHRIFEAARWAPSAYNSQPWRFIYAKRGTPDFEKFVNILVEGNRGWAKHASVLMFLLSRTVMRPPGADKDVPARAHSLEHGALPYFPPAAARAVTVNRFDGLADHPACIAYVDRATARPAFAKAHADQMAHFAAAD